MIKKLRKRFVVLAMLSLAAVLAVIIAGVNIINYNGVVKKADDMLLILMENEGEFPRGEKMPIGMSPETPFELRYFSVTLDGAGAAVSVETERIAAVDDGVAAQYAELVSESGADKGFYDDFRYLIRSRGDGTARAVFLDCRRDLDIFCDFLFASILISTAGYAVVFALVAFLSGRIVKPVAESYEKQKRFITDAGHEIKTPLTIINADADVLMSEMGDNEWLSDIRKQTKRLTALTNDLVYLARMEEAEKSVVMIDFPVSDVVGEAAQSFQSLAHTQQRELICRIEPMLSLRGNEKAIHQLTAILLDNALKYSPEGSVVELTFGKQGKNLVLTVANAVENTLPRDAAEMLFDRFYRADLSRNSGVKGFGIGLSVARAIVGAHGGRISADSTDGRFLKVTASFPV